MPDPTTNYGWDVPTVGGDVGAWGTILNTVFDDIDTDLKAAEDKADEANTFNLAGTRTIMAADGVGTGATFLDGWLTMVGSAGSLWRLPLRDLREGQRITAFATHGLVSSGVSLAVSLCYKDVAGTETVVSAGHTHTETSATTKTTSGLTHDVLADKSYYLKFDPGTLGSLENYAVHVAQITLEAAP
jgi:hypothetical protein